MECSNRPIPIGFSFLKRQTADKHKHFFMFNKLCFNSLSIMKKFS